MLEFRTFYYDPSEKLAFRHDGLWREWAERYPNLFDAADVRQMESQAKFGKGYGEWLAAIRLHEESGYNCLLAKYQFKSAHTEKYEKFARLVPASVLELLPHDGTNVGPDLLIYAPSMDEWFFAEAKRQNEDLTPSQRKLFPRLERAWGQEIRVVRLCPNA